MKIEIWQQAATNVAGEPVSIEPDGTVWADSDGRVIDLTTVKAEVARLEAIEAAEQPRRDRLAAFQAESDPLYFEWQRGEGTEQAWLDKVAEIRARYPDPA